MKPKSEAELIRFAAENIMNYRLWDLPNGLGLWWCRVGFRSEDDWDKIILVDDWNPLSDAGAYQLDLLEEVLVKLGIKFDSKCDAPDFFIDVWCLINPPRNTIVMLSHGRCEYDKTQIRLCKLTCFVEAFEKYLEVKDV